jgi:hypothetical protein
MKLWQILNVKSTDKGIRKRDSDCNPIRDVHDDQLKFLQDFYYWLVQWKSFKLKNREGCLTRETMFALKHTVKTFLALIPYLLTDMKMSYVLTGKFQTDCLERRFSMYRRMSGTNYHVSPSQVYDSEKKLKIVSMLKLLSKISVSIKDFIADCSDAINSGADNTVDGEFLNVINDCDINVSVSESECKSLIFISGYVAHKLLKNKINCELCKNELITEHSLEVEIDGEQYMYLHDLDRGGLRWPTDLLVDVVTQVFLVFRCLISDKYETKFQIVSNQKALVIKLSLDRLNTLELLLGECVCGTKMHNVFEHAVVIIVNILLNNYCKRSMDLSSSIERPAKMQRKLKTFIKT